MKVITLIAGLVFWQFVLASTSLAQMAPLEFESWIQWQEQRSIERMLKNISPEDAAPGVVIASPERVSPPYYFHWVRDSAVTIDLVVDLYQESDGDRRLDLERRLLEFARFSHALQLKTAKGGLGEPKYYIDGTPYDGEWCRPQNDGPAMRAIAMAKFAQVLLDQNRGELVKQLFYDGAYPTLSLIKKDLEYTASKWAEKNCDLWEEVRGHHFYTRMVQRRALIEGAKLAQRLGDAGAAAWYLEQAELITQSLPLFWRSERGYLVASLEPVGFPKPSGLDAGTILAFLHGDPGDGTVSALDQRAQATLTHLTEAFREIYPINRRPEFTGVGIGRYPEDIYGGHHNNHGNPWVLLTAGFAQFNYQAAREAKASGEEGVMEIYRKRGDIFLKRIQAHSNPDGSLSEQFDRHHGFMTSAKDLTWSHVEFIRAARARRGLR